MRHETQRACAMGKTLPHVTLYICLNKKKISRDFSLLFGITL